MGRVIFTYGSIGLLLALRAWGGAGFRDPNDPNRPLLLANDSAGQLLVIDVNSLRARRIGWTPVAFNDIAFDPQDRLYGLAGQSVPLLYRIDPNTAETEWVGMLDTMGFYTGLVFDPNGVLWAAGHHDLVRIDPNTARVTPVGLLDPYRVAGDLALDPNERLVMTTTVGDLVAWDPCTASPRAVGPLPDTDLFGLARDPNGVLYALNSTGRLFTVDPNTGARRLLGPLDCDFDLRIPWGAAFLGEARRPADPNGPAEGDPNVPVPTDPNHGR